MLVFPSEWTSRQVITGLYEGTDLGRNRWIWKKRSHYTSLIYELNIPILREAKATEDTRKVDPLAEKWEFNASDSVLHMWCSFTSSLRYFVMKVWSRVFANVRVFYKVGPNRYMLNIVVYRYNDEFVAMHCNIIHL